MGWIGAEKEGKEDREDEGRRECQQKEGENAGSRQTGGAGRACEKGGAVGRGVAKLEAKGCGEEEEGGTEEEKVNGDLRSNLWGALEGEGGEDLEDREESDEDGENDPRRDAARRGSEVDRQKSTDGSDHLDVQRA